MSKQALFILALIIFVGNSSDAQQKITSSDFLSKVIQSTDDTQTQKSNQFVDNQEVKLGLIDEIIVRTETEEFDLGGQEYALRFKPANRRLNKLKNQLYQSELEEVKLATQNDGAIYVRLAYGAWLMHVLNAQEIVIYKDLLTIQEDKLTVLEKQLLLPNFEPLDLLKEEDELQQIQMNIKTLESGQDQSNEVIQVYYEQDISTATINYDRLISITGIKKILSETATKFNPFNHPDFASFQLKQSLLGLEYELIEAERKNIFDFAQIKYAGPHDNPFAEKISIGIGLKIPTNKDRFKLKDLDLKNLENSYNFDQDMVQRNQRLTTIRTELVALLDQYDFLLAQAQQTKYSYDDIAKRYAQSTNASPASLLSIKEIEYKKSLRQLQLVKDIYEAYLDWLYWSGKMTEQPYINYLSADLDRL